MSADPAGADIAEDAPGTLADKAELPWPRMAVLAVLAGGFIGFGSIAFLVTQASLGSIAGPAQLLSGIAFSAGLLMVMVTGAELFTGNTMFVLPVAAGELSGRRLAGAWALVWAGNLVGGIAVALLFAAAGGLDGLDGMVGEAAARVAQDKLGKAPLATFASGVLANILVCLAVWMAMGARSVAARAVAVAGPVAIFVAAGFEHSIANMSLLPIGLIAGAGGGGAGAAALNLLLSTAGNVVGGGALALALGYGHGKDGQGDDD